MISFTPRLRGPRPGHRVVPGIAVAAIFLLTACARVPAEPPAPPVVQMAGTFAGTLTVDGNVLPARMTVTQTGPTLGMRLNVAEVGIASEGEGVAHPDRFTGRIPFQLTCPGEAVFEGFLEEEGRVLRGTVRATDCNSTMNGTFRFTRQD